MLLFYSEFCWSILGSFVAIIYDQLLRWGNKCFWCVFVSHPSLLDVNIICHQTILWTQVQEACYFIIQTWSVSANSRAAFYLVGCSTNHSGDPIFFIWFPFYCPHSRYKIREQKLKVISSCLFLVWSGIWRCVQSHTEMW